MAEWDEKKQLSYKLRRSHHLCLILSGRSVIGVAAFSPLSVHSSISLLCVPFLLVLAYLSDATFICLIPFSFGYLHNVCIVTCSSLSQLSSYIECLLSEIIDPPFRQSFGFFWGFLFVIFYFSFFAPIRATLTVVDSLCVCDSRFMIRCLQDMQPPGHRSAYIAVQPSWVERHFS